MTRAWGWGEEEKLLERWNPLEVGEACHDRYSSVKSGKLSSFRVLSRWDLISARTVLYRLALRHEQTARLCLPWQLHTHTHTHTHTYIPFVHNIKIKSNLHAAR